MRFLRLAILALLSAITFMGCTSVERAFGQRERFSARLRTSDTRRSLAGTKVTVVGDGGLLNLSGWKQLAVVYTDEHGRAEIDVPAHAHYLLNVDPDGTGWMGRFRADRKILLGGYREPQIDVVWFDADASAKEPNQ